MGSEVGKEAISSLDKTKKACRLISLLMKVLFGLLGVWWLFTASLMVFALVHPSALNSAQEVGVLTLVVYTLHGMVVGAICLSLIKIFSDSAKGESPFVLQQVKVLRFISIMLVLYAVTEFLVSAGAAFMKVDGFGFGYASVANGPMVTFNLAPIIAAAVVFAFSFVFKYGVLLQELSDETL